MLNRGLDKLELLRIAEAVANEKSIDKELVIESMESAIQKAALTKFGQNNNILVKIDRNTGNISIQKVLDVLEGSYAIAVIWAETPDVLIVAKSKAPLLIGFGEGEFLCASDTPAFVGFTRTVLPLEEKELAL